MCIYFLAHQHRILRYVKESLVQWDYKRPRRSNNNYHMGRAGLDFFKTIFIMHFGRACLTLSERILHFHVNKIVVNAALAVTAVFVSVIKLNFNSL